MSVVTVLWALVGYSLAFSGNIGGVIGNLFWIGLHGVGAKPGPYAPHIPALAHFVFQEMFAIITPALITGAFADRVSFKSRIATETSALDTLLTAPPASLLTAAERHARPG